MTSLAKWLSVCLWTKWMWVRVQLQSPIVPEEYLRCYLVIDFFKSDSLSFKKKTAAISCGWDFFPPLNVSSSRSGMICDVCFSPALLTSLARIFWDRSLLMTWSCWSWKIGDKSLLKVVIAELITQQKIAFKVFCLRETMGKFTNMAGINVAGTNS